MYNLIQTIEARNDLDNLVFYMIYSLKNVQASEHFLQQYYEQIQKLTIFPFGYRGIGITYQGYEIRMKPFLTYNIFFVVDEKTNQITILRVLKDRQNWKHILHNRDEYSF
jgi:plasmid stabilization system protein ParE